MSNNDSANLRQVGGGHYSPGSSYQHWDFAAENNLDYFEGQVTKYISRWKRKAGLQDLEKALHYADKLYQVAARSEKLFWRNPRPVKGLPAMATLYQLDRQEQLVFRAAVEYRTLEDLAVMRGAIRNLIEQASSPAAAEPKLADR